MNELTAELQAVADDISAAGVPASTDPGMVLQLAAAYPAIGLVSPPDELRIGLGMAAIDLDVLVTLITAGPDNLDATDRLYQAAIDAAPAAPPIQFVTRDTYTAGEVDLPALKWATARRITYPTGA